MWWWRASIRRATPQAIEKLKAQSNARVLGVPTDLNDAAAVERAVQDHARRVRPARHPGQQRHQRRRRAASSPWTRRAWDHAFDHKLRGTVRCIRHAVPPMRERKWGRIVNVSGGAAWTPQLGAITTGLNNAAVQNLTVALANDLGKDGILVNAVVPTAIRTDRHDKNIRDAMAKTGQSGGRGAEAAGRARSRSAAWARPQEVAERGRVPGVGARKLRHRQRLGGRRRRVGAAVESPDDRRRLRSRTGTLLKRFARLLAGVAARRSRCRARRAGRRLSDAPGHHRGRVHARRAERRAGAHHRQAAAAKSCISRSSSRTGPAPAATSPPSRSRARRPTATRC